MPSNSTCRSALIWIRDNQSGNPAASSVDSMRGWNRRRSSGHCTGRIDCRGWRLSEVLSQEVPSWVCCSRLLSWVCPCFSPCSISRRLRLEIAGLGRGSPRSALASMARPLAQPAHPERGAPFCAILGSRLRKSVRSDLCQRVRQPDVVVKGDAGLVEYPFGLVRRQGGRVDRRTIVLTEPL